MEIGEYKGHNTYEDWMSGLTLYLDGYEKGLKKQANAYISKFVTGFEHSVSKEDLQSVLEQLDRKSVV